MAQLLLLPFAPWLLPRVVRSVSERSALRVGFLLLLAHAALLAGLELAAEGPFAEFRNYLEAAALAFLFSFAVLFALALVPSLVAGAIFFDVFFRPERSESRQLLGRMLCLCPLALLLPTLGWFVIRAARTASAIPFGNGAPAWIDTPEVAAAGSLPAGLLNLAALAALTLVLTRRQLRVAPPRSTTRHGA